MADGVTDTESAILDAALAEVLAHGIRRTTASDIARRCGIARQTLYRYWPDAQAIFAALVTRELLRVLPGGAPAPASLDDLVSLLVETAGPDGNVVKLLPALTIDADELADGLDRLAGAVKRVYS